MYGRRTAEVVNFIQPLIQPTAVSYEGWGGRCTRALPRRLRLRSTDTPSLSSHKYPRFRTYRLIWDIHRFVAYDIHTHAYNGKYTFWEKVRAHLFNSMLNPHRSCQR